MARYSKLNRLYLGCKLEISKIITIEGEDFNYLKSVIRMKQGMELRVFNDCDGEFVASVIDVSRRSLSINIIAKLRESYHQSSVILAMSIIKPDKFIQAVTSSAGFGLKTIVPILTQNTQYDEINETKLRRCLVEAIEQCERMYIPQIAPILRLSEFIQTYMHNQIFFADEHSKITENGSAISIENVACIKKMDPSDEPVILIGPEGGFAEIERDNLLKMPKITPICLGESVLRAEIAAVSSVSLVQLLRSC